MAFRGIQSSNLISNEVGFADSIVILNKDSSLPTDVGFLGRIGPSTYAGLVRDHETNSFLLIDSVDLTPQSLNQVSAGAVTPGNITVGTLTATTLIAGNLPTQYTDANTRSAISVSGDLSYDSSTGVISYSDSDTGDSNRVVYDLANPTGSIVLNPGTQPHVATYYGDVINSAGNVILDISSTSATFTGGLMGNVMGDLDGYIRDTNGNVLLNNDHGNAGFGGNISSSGASSFSGSANFTGATISGFSGDTAGTHTGNVVGNVTGNVTGNIEGNIINSQGQPVIDNSGALYPTIFQLPKGIASERPSPASEGMMFFNTTTKMFEGYNGTAWVQLIPSTYVETP